MNVFVRGMGAVCPAGWGVNSMRDAIAKGEPLPPQGLPRPGWADSLRVRTVPPVSHRPEFLAHPRLRRASPITHYTVAAALEALGTDATAVRAGSIRLGIVLCVMAGCVNYSRRFYDETLRDAATASPLLFPETVFNAPASHLATLLGSTGVSYTLVGDPGMFLAGLALAADWMADGRVDSCLVVSAEEVDWLVADASRRFDSRTIVSEGAGALYLSTTSRVETSIQLTAVTDAHSFLQHRSRAQAVAAMHAQLPRGSEADLLCDSLQGSARNDAEERRAWIDWKGARISPKVILGEGFAAASAWQCVAAVDALKGGRYPNALVSVVGCNQQAIGAALATI